IREDPRQGELLIEGTEYLRCELYQAQRREMITRLEDFLRRRSKISLVATDEQIRQSPGLMEACRILFGDQAQERFDEYFADMSSHSSEALGTAPGTVPSTTEMNDTLAHSASWK